MHIFFMKKSCPQFLYTYVELNPIFPRTQKGQFRVFRSALWLTCEESTVAKFVSDFSRNREKKFNEIKARSERIQKGYEVLELDLEEIQGKVDQYLAWLKKKEEQVQLTQPQGFDVSDADKKLRYVNVSILLDCINSFASPERCCVLLEAFVSLKYPTVACFSFSALNISWAFVWCSSTVSMCSYCFTIQLLHLDFNWLWNINSYSYCYCLSTHLLWNIFIIPLCIKHVKLFMHPM